MEFDVIIMTSATAILNYKKNKFVYTTEQSRVIGQEQLCPKIMKKVQ